MIASIDFGGVWQPNATATSESVQEEKKNASNVRGREKRRNAGSERGRGWRWNGESELGWSLSGCAATGRNESDEIESVRRRHAGNASD